MKKVILSFLAVILMTGSSFAATWVAADRVAPVGKVIVEKNGLPAKTTFKVVNGAVDNSMTNTTKSGSRRCSKAPRRWILSSPSDPRLP